MDKFEKLKRAGRYLFKRRELKIGQPQDRGSFERRVRIFFTWTRRRRAPGFFRVSGLGVVQFRQRVSPEGEVRVLELRRRAGVRLQVDRRAVLRREDVVHDAALARVPEMRRQ